MLIGSGRLRWSRYPCSYRFVRDSIDSLYNGTSHDLFSLYIEINFVLGRIPLLRLDEKFEFFISVNFSQLTSMTHCEINISKYSTIIKKYPSLSVINKHEILIKWFYCNFIEILSPHNCKDETQTKYANFS